jgi:hypothetical protein
LAKTFSDGFGLGFVYEAVNEEKKMDQSVAVSKAAPVLKSTDESKHPATKKLGLVLLSGVVVGSMIGGGSFNLPANMASSAGLAAIIIAWVITFVGMFFLSNAFRVLSDKRPDLKAGIYSYAHAGFGPFAGFQMAWGYWLSSAFGNVASDIWQWSELAVTHRRVDFDMGHVFHRHVRCETHRDFKRSRQRAEYNDDYCRADYHGVFRNRGKFFLRFLGASTASWQPILAGEKHDACHAMGIHRH